MFWFTTLVSKQSHLSSIYKTLNKVNVVEIKTIDMAQGQNKPHNRVDLWVKHNKKTMEVWTVKIKRQNM
jgi:23S rRNA (adenine1618-N6)-methyltransferase